MKRNMVRRTSVLPLGAAALMGSVALPAAAWAQGPAPGNEAALEEIVVTAEKRAEGLQNIPIAITALSDATLVKAGVKEVGDLVQLTPSLQFGTRSTNVFIAMRGIGQAGQDIGSQSGVTVSLDGVPLLNHFMMNPSFMDIERVEVLRGPQGTIAGRNATGGAINIYSRGPTRQDDGSLSLTVGDRSRLGLRGYINRSFSDQLAGRLSFQREEANGWLKNDYIGKRNDDTDVAEVRGQLLFTPTDTFSLSALVDYTRDRSDPGFAQILGRADPARPTVPELPTYTFPRNDPKNLTFYFNEPNRRYVEDVRARAVATWELSPSMTLTSTTGFIRHDIDLTDLDVDGTPAPNARFDLIGLYAEQVTQELTLTADLGERADLVAGAFYMHGDSSEPLYLSLPTFRNYLVYLPEEQLDSYAAYAQFRYQFTDKLRATVGGRYTTDEKSYRMASSVGGVPGLNSDAGKFSAFTPRFVLDYTPTDETLVYASLSRGFKSGGFNTLGDVSLPVNRFNPEYVWNYELGLKAMMFDRKLRIGLTGFYADYTNLQQTVFRLNDVTQVRFPRVENSTGATIKGVEFEAEANPIRGLRLTGAVTYLDAQFGFFCNNDPLYPSAPTSPSCVGATRDGQPLPAGAVQLEGHALTQAPHWQYNTSAQYTFPVSDALNLTARVDYKWQSRTYFDIYNNLQNSQAAYGLLNGSLELATQDRAWALLAWVRNAADKRYISQGSAGSGANAAVTGSLGLPRMYGVTLTRQF
jgi:iron complex outermembrane recepter protein